jgi:hypothetical protein
MTPRWYLVSPLGWTQVFGWDTDVANSLGARGLSVVQLDDEGAPGENEDDAWQCAPTMICGGVS